MLINKKYFLFSILYLSNIKYPVSENYQSKKIVFKDILKSFITFFILFFYTLIHAGNEGVFESPERGYTSWLPGQSWDNAMLTGNGIMGAMIMGQPLDETIIFNHAKLYMPAIEPMKPINQVSRFNEIRRLNIEGKYEEAAKIPVEISLQEGYGGLRWTDPYMPAFDLKVAIDPSNIKRYLRKVDFVTAETVVCWEDTYGTFQKKLFVSRADNVAALIIKGTDKINCRLAFDRRPVEWQQLSFVNENIETYSCTAEKNYLVYRSGFKKRWKGSLQGYEGVARIINKGGTLTIEGNYIVIKNADEVLLFLRIEPSYDYSHSKVEQMKIALDSIPPDYQQLLNRHVKIHGAIFNRMKLDLDGSPDDANLTAEIMNQTSKLRPSKAFIEKQFDAARYNIICATGINPPNLQGIWNGNWTPPWSSDFTQDGNLETAVSSMLCANMPELLIPFFDYEDKMLPYYRDNSKNLYGCRGIQVPSRTSTHGWNIHFSEGWPLTFWNAGAGWIANFYYDYWLYTGDKKFLIERAYPFMKEAALFYEDFLITGKDRKFVFNPSYSPENNPSTFKSQNCINATMDVTVAKQLLRNCIDVGKHIDENKDILLKWERMLQKMPKYEIDTNGVFREWLWPGLEENFAHRHVSHLYGLFDLVDPEIANNPRLLNGCKKAIEERMKIRRQENGGNMVFGMVNMAWAAENLGESETAEEIINWLSSRYWSNSMATYHDPGGLFNMDLSGGFPSVIIKALVYSERGRISLLPALPSSWNKGKIEGALLRGQIELQSLSWNFNGVNVNLRSDIDQKIIIKLPGAIKKIDCLNKIKITKNTAMPSECVVELPKGETVIINFTFNKTN